MASLENKYGKSAVDATRRNALPPYLDTLFEGGIVNKTDIATTSALGLVKPDGDTVTIDADGTIHSQSSGFGGVEMHGVDLAANAWSNKTQTVTISTYAIATSDFLSVPQIETSSEYSASGVVLSSATVNVSAHTASLVFSCTTVPTATVSTTVLVSTSAMETGIALADAIANYPKIQNGKWYVWNVSTKQWVDTGVKAGITSIVQTTTSTADGGTNVVTATLSDGTKTTFNIKNGQKGSTGAKGDTGAAAGFANPTATATTLSPGSAAAASVTASGGNTMKQFDFSFGIPQGEKGDKGDKGDTGAAAGFGTPTASATTIAAGSSATASVTASGSNTSKVFAFTFGIPKGEKGAKGDTGATGPTGPTGPAGSGIQSIARTSGTGEAGSTDTYTITLTNGNTTTFQVKNGNDGKGLAMRKATLTANGWSNNSQTVQISASASAASDFLSIPEADTNDIYAGAGVKMTSVSINEGTVDCTFTCTTTPTADVNTVILVSTSNESIEEYLNGIVDNMTDLYNQTEADFNTASGLYVKKAGDTMTGTLVAPIVQTGSAEANYFQTRKMRGEGSASTYYHAIDFGYAGHNQVDFYEYGGLWNFYKNTTADGSGKVLVGKISANGWEGNVVGDVTGNASSATTASKATADGSGNNIVNTYATKTALDNKVDKVTGKGLSTNDFTDALLSKLNGIESGAQVNTVTGVKGNSESTYRTGNINITKANIGLGNVDNTSDANKPISTATQTALDAKVDKVTGMGLSSNDFTTAEKNKLSGIEAGAQVNTITGVKGNAESSYRTGNVNITKANVGLGNVDNTKQMPISGGTFTNLDNVFFTASVGSVLMGSQTASILNSPEAKYIWHDVWAFCRAQTPTYEVTTNGSTWTSATLEKRLFAHQNAWGKFTILTSTQTGARWTWADGGFGYSSAPWLAIGVTYTNPAATFDVKLESSADSFATSTVLLNKQGISANQVPIFIRTNTSSQNGLRLTITKNSGASSESTLAICSLMLLSYRWGDQGKGEEYEHPYTWDASYNISPLSGAKFVGDLTGTASRATADASGNNIKTTYLNGGSISVTPSTTTVNSITAVGSLSSLTFTPNSTSKNMTIAWNAGTLPTKGANTTVATGISSATFTGTHPS